MALMRKLRPPEWLGHNGEPPQRHSRTSTSESSFGSEFSAASYSSASSHEAAPRRHDPKAAHLAASINTPGSRSSMPILPTQFQQYRHFSQSQQSPAAAPALAPPPACWNGSWSGVPPGPAGRKASDSTEASGSVSDDDSDFGGSSCSEGAGTRAKSHPYYHQWKQYYETLAAAKAADAPQPMPKTRTAAGAPLQQQAPRTASPNSLVASSRRSTMFSARSASVPSLSQEPRAAGSRSVSITATVPEPRRDGSLQPRPSGLVRSKRFSLDTSQVRSVAHGLNRLAISREDSGQISDYAAFLMEDSSASEPNDSMSTTDTNIIDTYIQDDSVEEEPEQPPRRVLTNTLLESIPHDEPSGDTHTIDTHTVDTHTVDTHTVDTRTIDAHASDAHTIDTQTVDSHTIGDSHPSPQQTILQPDTPGDLDRQNSSCSTTSYNSLQSEGNLHVGRHPNRVAKPAPAPRPESQFFPEFLPPMSGPPPPMISPNGFYNPASPKFSAEHRRSTSALSGNALPINNAYMQQIQQQIQQIQQFQQMQQMQQMQMTNSPYRSASPQAPQAVAYSSDPTINKRIDEFLKLRQVIASGNKTFEYRVKWLQMLVTATNYKLYAYINIKGEPISSEHAAANRQFFVRSCENHLQKLLRELDSDRLKGQDKHLAEVCFVQGCLYRQSYLEKYGQDFGFEFNEEEAERFFNLCLSYNPAYFRACYELGELYEAQADEDKFDVALENYKESAQMGYNRAIYKVALIHMLVPKVRSTKFLKYLKKLAAIDMESADVELSGPDRDELEEIVGLAQFQLGKIYEGIYPGDLTIDDALVRESLELAPVNYSKSLSYYNRAAKLNCLLAQVRLGHVYEEGDLNRNQNTNKSIQWFIKASTSPLKFKRHPEAMLGLSRWFLRGSDGMNKHIPYPSVDSAVQWCERACKEFGLPEAFYQMGLLCEQGYVADDAGRWYEEAYRGGHLEAAQRLGIVPEAAEAEAAEAEAAEPAAEDEGAEPPAAGA